MVTQTETHDTTKDVLGGHRDGVNISAKLLQAKAESPIYEVSDGPADWIVLGVEEVRAVLSDTERFSNAPAEGPLAGNFLQYDPPEHGKLRRMLAPEFAPRRMRASQSMVEEIVRDCVDDMEEAGSPDDLMRRFAWPVTALVSCVLFGLPRDDALEMMRLNTIRSTGGGPNEERAMLAYDNYRARLVEHMRREPGDDMMGRLVREYGHELTDDELGGILDSVVFAQLEGMAQMLGVGVLVLLQHPDQLALLRSRPELIDTAVEELMRYVTIVTNASPRRALTDVPLAGRVIRKGQLVRCSLLAANRSLSPEEDRLDITREHVSHIALGHGIHFCVGAALGRIQLRAGLTEVLDRFPGLRLAVPEEELSFRLSSGQFGVNALPVAW